MFHVKYQNVTFGEYFHCKLIKNYVGCVRVPCDYLHKQVASCNEIRLS